MWSFMSDNLAVSIEAAIVGAAIEEKHIAWNRGGRDLDIASEQWADERPVLRRNSIVVVPSGLRNTIIGSMMTRSGICSIRSHGATTRVYRSSRSRIFVADVEPETS